MKASKEIIFSERIASSVSHELRNILAVIKESSGLLQDLVMLGKYDDSSGKLKKITDTILKQVFIGEETTTHLNKFAHLNDKDIELFSCEDELKELIGLIKRPIKQKGLNISLNCMDDIKIQASRFFFQMTAYFIINEIIKSCEYGSCLEISLSIKNETVKSIEFKAESVSEIDIEVLKNGLEDKLMFMKSVLEKNGNIIELKISGS
ncbi:MAG: HAMP domain-containing histidine kinase [Desulfobacteraceae bacterium]|nr:HAMP domain-containing histidine kinase [Desulfobacteraceae bacterium]